ncbi:Carbonic anhydrase [Handroanthus impetiginosus]|uniref:Carbonic anhydrase n=1 Tax=Handroanthus impetiginosus TaxID=429701 RepID=A0A2G9HU44_9LAMI|nr:Carbonic anhydrase [Handroanthus impetiginosus]
MAAVRCPDVFVVCLLLCFLFMKVSAEETEAEDESPFTYDRKSKRGPGNWGNLNPTWKVCGNGRFQSPIDLADDRVVVSSKLGILRRAYKPAPAIIRNRGHDIMVAWEGDAGVVRINGTEYKLLQCHWHTPAEHTFDGKRFLFNTCFITRRPDPFLAKLLQKIKIFDHNGINIGVFDPWDIKFGSRKYFRYIGSLTVPPCTEGVVWSILKKVRTVSLEQIRALRDAVHDGFEDNARPIQESDDIAVYMFRPQAQ